MKPDATYVTRLLMSLRQNFDGTHRKMDELDRLRFYEDTIKLNKAEKQSGIEVRVGLTADLVENVKASIVASPPVVMLTPMVSSDPAVESSTERAAFWNAVIQKKINRPFPKFNAWVDAIVGLGYGVFKCALGDYPEGDQWLQMDGESNTDFNSRTKAMKAVLGPPIDSVNVHPLAYFFRLGKDMQVVESIEHSWKPRADVFRTFGINDSADLRAKNLGSRLLSKSVQTMMENGTDKEIIEAVIATQGQPEQFVRPLPAGTQTQTLALVTEYWSPDWYQVYINRTLVYEKENPQVKYFLCIGGGTSSTDIDKLGLGVAESLRHNEPTINRAITRMMEANEMLVNKRLTVELPDGSVDGIDVDEKGESVPRKFTFTGEFAEALPPGAKVVDPFDSAHYVFQSMPAVQLLMDITSKHGVSPIFKGQPAGAQGSGYRDNSLYAMSKQKFNYMIESYTAAIIELIRWLEQQAVIAKENWYMEDRSLMWEEVQKYPCVIDVSISPALPQNTIAEGEFLSQMHDKHLLPKRIVVAKGLNEENPAEIEREVILDQLKEAMLPALLADVMSSVGGVPGQTAQTATGQPPQQPPVSMQPQPRPTQTPLNQARQAEGRSVGGMTTGGQPRNPAVQPATLPPNSPPPGA